MRWSEAECTYDSWGNQKNYGTRFWYTGKAIKRHQKSKVFLKLTRINLKIPFRFLICIVNDFAFSHVNDFGFSHTLFTKQNVGRMLFFTVFFFFSFDSSGFVRMGLMGSIELINIKRKILKPIISWGWITKKNVLIT